KDRVLHDRVDRERVALLRRAGFRPEGRGGDDEVLGAVLAGMEAQRVELRRRTAPGAGNMVVAAAAEQGEIVRQAGDRDTDRAVVAVMRRNAGTERDQAAFLAGAARGRTCEHRVLLNRIDGERIALLRRAGFRAEGCGG